MKVCPACRTSYDDSQNFCLNDGTPLVLAETEPEAETVIAEPADNYDSPSPQTTTAPASSSGQGGFKPSPPIIVPTGSVPRPPRAAPTPARHQPVPQVRLMKRHSYTGWLIGLSSLAALLLLGSAWWMFSENERDFTQTNTNSPTIPSPSVVGGSSNANIAPSGNAGRTANVATGGSIQTANQSGSVASGNPAPPSERSPSETNQTTSPAENAPPPASAPPIEQAPPQPPQPPLAGREAARARGEARGVLNGWIDALRSGDLNAHLAYYADTVDYYRGRYNRSQILADKQRAFQDYDDIEMRASNIRVTNLTATTATVLYDKEWRFSSGSKINAGKVLSELRLTKIGDRWLITGERDLRVYYTRSS